MNRPLARLLLRSYPVTWRAQYGQELEDLLCQRPTRLFDILDLIWSGFLERMRQPLSRLSLYALAGTAVTYVVSLVFARPLWGALATPVTDVLREQGIRPSAMIATRPLEQMEVVWLGVPALVTVLITFMLMLMLIWKFFSDAKEPEIRQWARRFVSFSGAVFAVCAVLSTLAWQNGSIAKPCEWPFLVMTVNPPLASSRT
jgi:hypothetical protein